jgi:hypothetical protein
MNLRKLACARCVRACIGNSQVCLYSFRNKMVLTADKSLDRYPVAVSHAVMLQSAFKNSKVVCGIGGNIRQSIETWSKVDFGSGRPNWQIYVGCA